MVKSLLNRVQGRHLIRGALLILLLAYASGLALNSTDKSQWVEGTQALDDGATRDYYNRAARLAWQNTLGDWRDAAGVPQGNSPYSAVTMIDDDTPEYIEWEVTGLVQDWLDGIHANQGLILHALSSGTFDFYSREHANPAQRPELVITAPGGTMTLSPEADTHLDSSTYQGFGDDDRLRVSAGNNTLIRFDLSGIAEGTTLTQATLRLYVYAEYGSGDIGVFRSEQGHALPPSDPIYGLAALFPQDQGLGSHPDVLLFSDFESDSWGDDWSYGTSAATLVPLGSDPARNFVPLQGRALRVKIPQGANTGMNVGFAFAQETGSEPEAIYMRYYLRFASDWETVDGGKMPGIAGTYGVAGWGGRPSDGTNGWSARGSFSLVVPQGNPLGETVPLGHYVYHADMEGIYGDIVLWQDDYRGYLERDRWYSIEQYLQMNTPGVNDGILRAWVDGRPAYEQTDWRWRDVDSLKIEEIWMNVYHGGTAPVDEDVHLYIDNVVIARQYIGPLAPQSLTLKAVPGDQSLHLNWSVNASLPVTTTWHIAYEGPPGDPPSPISGLAYPTRAYNLTGLTNYAWYTVTLNAMLDSTPVLSDTVQAMPSDLQIHIPLLRR